MDRIISGVIESVIYFGIGLLLCIIGYKLLSLSKKFNLDKEIDNHNMAAGFAVAGMFIAIAIIISGVIQ
ncbi:MAG: DUF350 domain-containing protein [Clostridia bacterium]|nr:DUF350 domain-containing protein [Clostridia bacterium]